MQYVLMPEQQHDYFIDHVLYCELFVGGAVAYSSSDLNYIYANPSLASNQSYMLTKYLLNNGVCCFVGTRVICKNRSYLNASSSYEVYKTYYNVNGTWLEWSISVESI